MKTENGLSASRCATASASKLSCTCAALAGLLCAGLLPRNAAAQVPAGYAGKPWHDTVLAVPGRLLPKNYDDGAIGVTYFDTDAHVGAYTARNPTGVDLDPVKTTDPTVPGSTVNAVPGEIYWGWLVANEWLKFTVDVKQAGTYTIHAMVGTAMAATSFKVDALEGTDSISSGTLTLPFTGTCPVECYHYWNYVKNLGTIALKAGPQVIRLQIVKAGYNIDYVDLALADAADIKTGKADMQGNMQVTADAGAGKTSGAEKADAAGRRLPDYTKASIGYRPTIFKYSRKTSGSR